MENWGTNNCYVCDLDLSGTPPQELELKLRHKETMLSPVPSQSAKPRASTCKSNKTKCKCFGSVGGKSRSPFPDRDRPQQKSKKNKKGHRCSSGSQP